MCYVQATEVSLCPSDPVYAVLTWAVYCLATNTDVQTAARQEVKRVCSQTGDITADNVQNMT